MRRLIGLIALLALILGGAWLAQNDFDLRQIARIKTLFDPPKQGDEVKPTPNDVAEAPSSSASSDGSGPSEDSKDVASTAEQDGMSSTGNPAEPAVGATGSDSSDKAGSAPESSTAEATNQSSGESELAAVDSSADVSEMEKSSTVVIVPSFDIVRVEPSGETVIAGLATPQATVEILSGAEALATAEANERGEWALVLEEPLPPGDHDLAVRTTTADQSEATLSDQRIAVSVPEGADEEPLVVLIEPDSASRIIQVPSEPEASPPPKVAEALPSETEPPMPSAEQADGAASSSGSEIAALPDTSSSENLTASDGAAVSRPPAMSSPSDVGDSARASGADASAPMAAAEPSAGPETTAVAPSTAGPPAARPGEPASASSSGGESTAASDTMGTAPMASAPAAPQSTARSDSDPSEQAVAAATPSESSPAAAGETTAVSDLAETAPMASASADPQTMEAPVAADEPAAIVPKVGVAAVEAETNGALYVAGTATTSEPVRIYIDEEFVGEATPNESGTWLLETDREMAPDEYKIRVDQVDGGSGSVVARAEVSFQREIDVATLTQTGKSAGGDGAVASGSIAGPMTVIIKRGDNLWRISRELYGKGVRYSTIYQANRDQIRNPNLIYPGQVFVLPTGNTAWEAQ